MLNILFAGTPEFATPYLQALLDSPHCVKAVLTQPDRPAGRGQHLHASPVKQLALSHDISIYQPENLKDTAVDALMAEQSIDVMVVVAYGLLIPERMLKLPRYGCINVHASLLPRWRGAAPIQYALLAGDKKTGVTIMQMDVGLDTGDMILKCEYQIADKDTAAELHDVLAQQGAKALLNALTLIESQQVTAESQNEAFATHAAKIKKDDAKINWTLAAKDIDRLIRAYHPWPIAFTELQGQRLRVFNASPADPSSNTGQYSLGEIIAVDKASIEIACGEGSLYLHTLQLPNKRPLPVSDLLHAYQDLFAMGQIFGAH